MVICLERGADLSPASVKSRLVLPFWYRLIRVVPEKRAAKRVYVCMSMYSEVVTDSYQQRDIRLAQSLMARSVILNVSGFETRCRISSVTLQPATEQKSKKK